MTSSPLETNLPNPPSIDVSGQRRAELARFEG